MFNADLVQLPTSFHEAQRIIEATEPRKHPAAISLEPLITCVTVTFALTKLQVGAWLDAASPICSCSWSSNRSKRIVFTENTNESKFILKFLRAATVLKAKHWTVDLMSFVTPLVNYSEHLHCLYKRNRSVCLCAFVCICVCMRACAGS